MKLVTSKDIQEIDKIAILITPELFKEYFRERNLESHKGTYGHVLTIAGSMGKIGAGWLTSKAALRSGAGLATYAIPSSAYLKFDTRFPEIMVEPVSDKNHGYFSEESLGEIRPLAQGKDVIAFGPGIGTKKETVKFTQEIVSKLSLPMVIDADGLNNLGEHLIVLKKRRSDTVLTPHPGEMARLMGVETKEIQKDRIDICRQFASLHKVTLVLKGYRTVVASPKGEIYINPTGNPGMSTAGMGDALTGMIAAFIANKIPTLEASIAASYIHGLAGDISKEKIGEVGMIASDLIDNIPTAIKLIRQWKPSASTDSFLSV